MSEAIDAAGTRLMAAFRRDVLAGAPLPCTAIDRRDAMFRFFLGQRQGHREMALVDYFATGRSAAQVVEAALRWRFGDDTHGLQLLDFASGYGRVTRFLVQRHSPRRLWVSDILPGAVEFQRHLLGVHGFPSHEEPGDLACDETFDAIAVASLFSHLPPPMFVPWLRRLFALLRPGGLLLFSVHDASLLPQVEGHVAGTRYDARSEIAELALDRYGTSWVEEPFVRAAVREATGAECVRVPRGLWSFQDVYLVCQGEPPREPPALPRTSGYVEHAERDVDGERLRVSGWAFDPGFAVEVEVCLDGECMARLQPREHRGDVADFLRSDGAAAAGWSCDVAREQPIPGEAVLAVVAHAGGERTPLHLATVEATELSLRLGSQLTRLRHELADVRRSRVWKLREAWRSVRGRPTREGNA